VASEAPAASNGSSGGGLVRRPSWGRKKKSKAKNDTPSPQNNSGGAQLSPSTKAKSLPGYALHRSQGGAPKLQVQCSYDADQEDDGDEFGIYSTIQEDKLKPKSSAEGEEVVVAGAVAAATAATVVGVAGPDDLKDDGVRHKKNLIYMHVYVRTCTCTTCCTVTQCHGVCNNVHVYTVKYCKVQL
jgi:hypothetical protein